MIYRGALLHISFFTDIDNGKKATPVIANRFREICGQAPLGLCACKIQVCSNCSKPEKRQGSVRGHDIIENHQQTSPDYSYSGYWEHNLENANIVMKDEN